MALGLKHFIFSHGLEHPDHYVVTRQQCNAKFITILVVILYHSFVICHAAAWNVGYFGIFPVVGSAAVSFSDYQKHMWLMLMYSKMTDVTEKYRNCRLCIFTSSEPWMVDHCVSVCVRTEYFVVIVMHVLFYTVFVILWAHYMNCVLLVIYWQLNYTAAVAAVIILKCWWMFELGWLGYLI